MTEVISGLFRYFYNKQYFLWVTIRTFFWSQLFKEFGKDSYVFGKITVLFPQNVKLGKNSTLNEGVLLNARAPINIGNYVHISPGVIISSGGLEFEQNTAQKEHFGSPIIIGDSVWIGSGAIILPGAVVGSGSVLAAGAVVTGKIAAGIVVAGIPAKFKKRLAPVKKPKN